MPTGNWDDYINRNANVEDVLTEGDGSEKSPYLIKTPEQMAYVSYMSRRKGGSTARSPESGHYSYSFGYFKYFELSNDIDLSDHYWNGDTAIYDPDDYYYDNHGIQHNFKFNFIGNLNGKDHTIRGINGDSLFGPISQSNEGTLSRIERIIIEDANITNSNSFFCGKSYNVTIKNITIKNSTITQPESDKDNGSISCITTKGAGVIGIDIINTTINVTGNCTINAITGVLGGNGYDFDLINTVFMANIDLYINCKCQNKTIKYEGYMKSYYTLSSAHEQQTNNTLSLEIQANGNNIECYGMARTNYDINPVSFKNTVINKMIIHDCSQDSKIALGFHNYYYGYYLEQYYSNPRGYANQSKCYYNTIGSYTKQNIKPVLYSRYGGKYYDIYNSEEVDQLSKDINKGNGTPVNIEYLKELVKLVNFDSTISNHYVYSNKEKVKYAVFVAHAFNTIRYESCEGYSDDKNYNIYDCLMTTNNNLVYAYTRYYYLQGYKPHLGILYKNTLKNDMYYIYSTNKSNKITIPRWSYSAKESLLYKCRLPVDRFYNSTTSGVIKNTGYLYNQGDTVDASFISYNGVIYDVPEGDIDSSKIPYDYILEGEVNEDETGLMKVFTNGKWVDVQSIKVYKNGDWVDVKGVNVYSNGKWK